MTHPSGSVEGAYDRGELTFARFADACSGCVQSRPSGSSYLCAKKEMRVFADSTCVEFEARDAGAQTIGVAVRRTLYRANLGVEMAVEQHEAVQAKVSAANAGRVA